MPAPSSVSSTSSSSPAPGGSGAAAASGARGDLVALLQALVQIPSANPPGDCRRVAAFCADFLRAAGFQTTLAAPDDRAWSVVGVLAGGRGADGLSLLYHAHIDTVPLGQNAHWSFDPFAGAVQDGRLYGLGSVDDKAPLAAMLHAAAALAQERARWRGTLVVVCAADEEVGGQLGTRWLVEQGYVPACDFVVVGEQTHNRAATAHKGVLRASFHVQGRTAHATDPWRGRNAINGMAHLIGDLEHYQREVLEQKPHPLLGPPSINVGVIEGGVSANVVADSCTIRVDRRMVPGEEPEVVKAELQAIVRQRQAQDPERTYTVNSFLVSNWYQTAADRPLVQRFLRACAAETGAPAEPVGYLPGSDAKHLVPVAREGMVVFGPGSYTVAHAADEYVEIAELQTTERVLRRFAADLLLDGGKAAHDPAAPAQE
jgi:acetylornithine deacetylase/succinyl-diaminopimelate desuccinylase family protein